MRLFSLLLLSLLAACSPQRTLYLGGPVITLDGHDTVAEALLVEGERIAAVGSREEVLRHSAASRPAGRGGRARVVDLQGRALLPGFIDAHGHFPGVGVFALEADLRSPPVGSVTGIDDLVARMKQAAASKGPSEWVVGLGYDDTLLAELRHPTRHDLDRVSTTQPVVIWHISFHLAVVNSRALEIMGIGAGTADPEGGLIQREDGSGQAGAAPATVQGAAADTAPDTARPDAAQPHGVQANFGQPNGVLEEEATNRLRNELMNFSLLDAVAIAREASRLYVSRGVTTAQNGLAEEKPLLGLSLLSRLGIIPLRMVAWPSDVLARELDAGRGSWDSYDREWLDIGAVKLIADGSIQAYTAYLTEPYHVQPGQDPGFRGYPRIEAERLKDLVGEFHGRGHQVAVHGNGDASIDDILDAFQAVQREHPRPDARPVIIHAQMTRLDQLDRMRELGVIPSFFVSHTYFWGDRHRDIFLGPRRAAAISPLRSALERGVLFTLHTDTPVVPMDPLAAVWSACNRETSSGKILGPEERIGLSDALKAVTINAAYQHFQEKEKGSLEAGKLADLVILSRSPLDDPATVKDIKVLETVIGGRTVYRAGG